LLTLVVTTTNIGLVETSRWLPVRRGFQSDMKKSNIFLTDFHFKIGQYLK